MNSYSISLLLFLFSSTTHAAIFKIKYDGLNGADNFEGSCNYQACDQLCRRRGFPGGACVGDRCQCDNFDPMPIKDVDSNELDSLRSCDVGTCEHFCKQNGFNKGTCIGDICLCTLEARFDDYVEASCNYQACDQLCRRLGFPGGACVGDRCQCDNFDPMSLKDFALNESPLLKSCTKGVCESFCKQNGFNKGTCIGDICLCTLEVKMDGNNLQHLVRNTVALDTCNSQTCDAICRSHRFKKGRCREDCVCYLSFLDQEIRISGEKSDLKKFIENRRQRSLKDVLMRL